LNLDGLISLLLGASFDELGPLGIFIGFGNNRLLVIVVSVAGNFPSEAIDERREIEDPILNEVNALDGTKLFCCCLAIHLQL